MVVACKLEAARCARLPGTVVVVCCEMERTARAGRAGIGELAVRHCRRSRERAKWTFCWICAARPTFSVFLFSQKLHARVPLGPVYTHTHTCAHTRRVRMVGQREPSRALLSPGVLAVARRRDATCTHAVSSAVGMQDGAGSRLAPDADNFVGYHEGVYTKVIRYYTTHRAGHTFYSQYEKKRPPPTETDSVDDSETPREERRIFAHCGVHERSSSLHE